MASRYAILPRSSIEVVHLPFHRGYRCLCSVTAAHSIRRGMARPRPFRCLFQFRNSFLLSLASGGEERTYTTEHGTTADLKRTVIPLARSFERGRKTGVTAPGEAFAPLASVSPAELGSARGWLRAQDFARHQARRPAGGAAGQIRAGRQPQDRQGAWTDRP